MALGDIQIYGDVSFGYPGSKQVNVAAGATTIYPGEPVATTLGGVTGTQAVTNSPVVGTDYWVGVAISPQASTNTAAAAGAVQVTKNGFGGNVTYLISPKVAATWDTQAKYDALVGKRVLLDLTAGVFTILAVDGATNGLVVEPMLITEYPGKVRFSIRNGVNYLS